MEFGGCSGPSMWQIVTRQRIPGHQVLHISGALHILLFCVRCYLPTKLAFTCIVFCVCAAPPPPPFCPTDHVPLALKRTLGLEVSVVALPSCPAGGGGGS